MRLPFSSSQAVQLLSFQEPHAPEATHCTVPHRYFHPPTTALHPCPCGHIPLNAARYGHYPPPQHVAPTPLQDAATDLPLSPCTDRQRHKLTAGERRGEPGAMAAIAAAEMLWYGGQSCTLTPWSPQVTCGMAML